MLAVFCSFGEGGLSFVGVLCIGAFTVKAYVHILPVIDFAMKCFINLPIVFKFTYMSKISWST